MATHYDVVIVGGGAAGLSAALALGRARRRVAVVDAGRPRNAPASHMHGYLSRDGYSPAALLEVGRGEVRSYGVEVIDGTVGTVGELVGAASGGRFVVRLSDGGELVARRLLVTSGVVDDLPAIAGLRERWGRDVLHCPYCHGWEVRDRPLGVLATLPGSTQYAQLVRQWSDRVVFFSAGREVSARERAELDARGITVVDGPVAALALDHDRLAGVVLADGTVVACEALFLRPGARRRVGDPAEQLGCEVDGDGLLVVGPDGATSVAGVWAAGNVVDPRGQVIAAAGAANTAAIAINADLVAEDVEVALGTANRG